jgi:hypothetical protein
MYHIVPHRNSKWVNISELVGSSATLPSLKCASSFCNFAGAFKILTPFRSKFASTKAPRCKILWRLAAKVCRSDVLGSLGSSPLCAVVFLLVLEIVATEVFY